MKKRKYAEERESMKAGGSSNDNSSLFYILYHTVIKIIVLYFTYSTYFTKLHYHAPKGRVVVELGKNKKYEK